MKRKDVMFSVLSEVTGLAKEEVEKRFPIPTTRAMEEDLSDEEAKKLLDELRPSALDGLKRKIRKISESN